MKGRDKESSSQSKDQCCLSDYGLVMNGSVIPVPSQQLSSLLKWGEVLTDLLDYAAEQADVELNDNDVEQAAYDIATALQLVAYSRKKKLGFKEKISFRRFTRDLLHLFLQAHAGNTKAHSQIKAIEKLIYPEKHDLGFSVINELANHYRPNPSRARGYQIRHLMAWALPFVESLLLENNDPTKGQIRLRSNLPDHMRNVWGFSDIVENLKPRSTLQSLAISMYFSRLQREGFDSITKENLRRDLRNLQEWEKGNPISAVTDNMFVADRADLPVRFYSEEWKQRKTGSGGRKTTPKAEESKLPRF